MDNDLLLQDAHTDTVRTLAWDPTGEKLISSGEDKTLKIWNVDRWSLIETRYDSNSLRVDLKKSHFTEKLPAQECLETHKELPINQKR